MYIKLNVALCLIISVGSVHNSFAMSCSNKVTSELSSFDSQVPNGSDSSIDGLSSPDSSPKTPAVGFGCSKKRTDRTIYLKDYKNTEKPRTIGCCCLSCFVAGVICLDFANNATCATPSCLPSKKMQ